MTLGINIHSGLAELGVLPGLSQPKPMLHSTVGETDMETSRALVLSTLKLVEVMVGSFAENAPCGAMAKLVPSNPINRLALVTSPV